MNSIPGYKKQKIRVYSSSWRHTVVWQITLPSWGWALLEKPPVVQLVRNFPPFYGTRRFITVFTWALRRSLSTARSNHSIPPHQIHFNIIHPPTSWSSYWFFPPGFPTNILHALLFSPIRATCPAHLILLGLIILNILDKKYKLWSPSLCSYLQPVGQYENKTLPSSRNQGKFHNTFRSISYFDIDQSRGPVGTW
jgi:hypothetical protein